MRKQQPLFRKKVSLIIRISERCIKTQRKRATKCEYILYFDSVVSPMAESPGVAAGGATLSPRPCVRRQLAARPGEGGGPRGSLLSLGGLWAPRQAMGCYGALSWWPQPARGANVKRHRSLYFGPYRRGRWLRRSGGARAGRSRLCSRTCRCSEHCRRPRLGARLPDRGRPGCAHGVWGRGAAEGLSMGAKKSWGWRLVVWIWLLWRSG